MGLDYIDLNQAFVTDKPPQAVYREYYLQRENGSVGHLNRQGHAKIAELVQSAIENDVAAAL